MINYIGFTISFQIILGLILYGLNNPMADQD
jgi:hypothetical protein